MAKQENNGHANKGRTGGDFRISNGPVDRFAESEMATFDLPEFDRLPRVGSFLCAIPRDPRTLFAYWQIDWPSVFRDSRPADRQVHLRVHRGNEVESTSAVEPMAGNASLEVPLPGATYRVELGYYEPDAVWHSVATSEDATMPVQGIADSDEVDLATIPLHLSFQRLIDLLRGQNGDALVEIIARLQKRAVSDHDRALLSVEDWEMLGAMDVPVDEFAAARRRLFSPTDSDRLRSRAEAILGFGATSPGGGFGGSSWS